MVDAVGEALDHLEGRNHAAGSLLVATFADRISGVGAGLVDQVRLITCACSTSGARSAPFGHTTVPNSSSTVTCAK